MLREKSACVLDVLLSVVLFRYPPSRLRPWLPLSPQGTGTGQGQDKGQNKGTGQGTGQGAGHGTEQDRAGNREQGRTRQGAV